MIAGSLAARPHGLEHGNEPDWDGVACDRDGGLPGAEQAGAMARWSVPAICGAPAWMSTYDHWSAPADHRIRDVTCSGGNFLCRRHPFRARRSGAAPLPALVRVARPADRRVLRGHQAPAELVMESFCPVVTWTTSQPSSLAIRGIPALYASHPSPWGPSSPGSRSADDAPACLACRGPAGRPVTRAWATSSRWSARPPSPRR